MGGNQPRPRTWLDSTANEKPRIGGALHGVKQG